LPDCDVLAVLGEPVVDLLPVPGTDPGSEGTALHYVARPGGKALNVDDAALVAALTCTRVGADPPTRVELDAARRAR
jgi:sugar/nucleoside kinase (ribokinase family)